MIEEINVAPPDEEVIRYIEDILARAKKGEIQSIACVMGKPNSITANSWAGMWKHNMAMIGEIEAMKVDMMRYYVESRIEYLEI